MLCYAMSTIQGDSSLIEKLLLHIKKISDNSDCASGTSKGFRKRGKRYRNTALNHPESDLMNVCKSFHFSSSLSEDLFERRPEISSLCLSFLGERESKSVRSILKYRL